MKKFLVLYRSSLSAQEQMAKATPEQSKAGMDAWMSWAGRAGDAVVDLGNPVAHAHAVPHGAEEANANQIGGFSILQALSSSDLDPLLQNHPHLIVSGNSIEVHEFLPMPGI